MTYASERAGRAQAGTDPWLRIEHVFDSVIDVIASDPPGHGPPATRPAAASFGRTAARLPGQTARQLAGPLRRPTPRRRVCCRRPTSHRGRLARHGVSHPRASGPRALIHGCARGAAPTSLQASRLRSLTTAARRTRRTVALRRLAHRTTDTTAEQVAPLPPRDRPQPERQVAEPPEMDLPVAPVVEPPEAEPRVVESPTAEPPVRPVPPVGVPPVGVPPPRADRPVADPASEDCRRRGRPEAPARGLRTARRPSPEPDRSGPVAPAVPSRGRRSRSTPRPR